MENRFGTRISRLLRGSFGSSCRTRNLSDDVEESVFFPHREIINKSGSVSSLKPQPRPFPTICRTTCPETATQLINHCSFPSKQKEIHGRRHPPLIPNSSKVHSFPPASPASSPLTRSYYQKKQSTQKQGRKKHKTEKKKKKKKKKKKSVITTTTTTQKREKSSLFSSPSIDFPGIYYWFSSDDEGEYEREEEEGDKNGYENDDESDTLLFSSRSLSSDSSALSARRRRRNRRRKRPVRGEIEDSKKGVANTTTKSDKMGGVLPLQGKVKGSFAVAKSSKDPYNDFRTSMVEMIVEKQIFGAKDLEHLLQCFLSLNSDHHHRIIVEVFTEIWETLFFDWSS